VLGAFLLVNTLCNGEKETKPLIFCLWMYSEITIVGSYLMPTME